MLKLIEVAGSSPVTLAELKAHCRIDSSDENAPLQIFLDAAIEFVSDRTSLLLSLATYRIERGDWWSGWLDIAISPIREIASVKYLDVNSSTVTVDPSLYSFERSDCGGRVELSSSFLQPAVSDARDAVQIEFDAGFDDPNATGAGDDPALALPDRAKQAVLLIAAHWYANREAAQEIDISMVPMAAEAILAQLRIYR